MRGRPPKLHLSKSLRIWVDGDACTPAACRMLFEVAQQRRVTLTLVWSRSRDFPNSPYIRSILVYEGFEGVSGRLLQLATEGDLVVSTDPQVLSQLSRRKIVALPPAEGRAFADLLDTTLSQIREQAAVPAVQKPKQNPLAATARS